MHKKDSKLQFKTQQISAAIRNIAGFITNN